MHSFFIFILIIIGLHKLALASDFVPPDVTIQAVNSIGENLPSNSTLAIMSDKKLNVCPINQVSIGPTIDAKCPTKYTPTNGQCCGVPFTCPEFDTVGPCVNGLCPNGFGCDETGKDSCCPRLVENEEPIGPCTQNEKKIRSCQEGYACVGEGEGKCRRLDFGTSTPTDEKNVLNLQD